MSNISNLTDTQLAKLIDSRWKSSDSVWAIVESTNSANKKAYNNKPEWLSTVAKKKSKVRANRIFVNTEAVINSVIANPAKPIIIPGRDTPTSKTLASSQEKYFQIRYTDRNVKEIIRKGLRNLYFSRLVVLKPFWDPSINDFNVRVVDPTKVRFSQSSTKEDDSEFAIEKIDDNICSVMSRFPDKKDAILKHFGVDEEDAYIENKEITYDEAWIGNYVVCKLGGIILDRKQNPYWDWDGIQITQEESEMLNHPEITAEGRRNILIGAKMRTPIDEGADVEGTKKDDTEDISEYETTKSGPAYYYNHFDKPRKPYIFATIFATDNKPIGETDFITQAIPLQEDIDETKRNITENAKIVNGIVKVDSTVMGQADANKLRFETGGVVWGKGVAQGVLRETGAPLPNFVLENLNDSRKELDDIMAASSAFRGVREGQETRGGRLALIDQSFLRLNELVQVIDYLNYELFNWFYQLAKVNYTEHHYAKTMGRDKATEIITLIQDDFEEGTEVRLIAGKTLPEDRQFKYEQAQKDLELGVLTPVDYLEVAGYDNPAQKAKNLVVYGMNKAVSVGISEEEMQKLSPPTQPTPDMPKMSMKYEDLPPDGQVQMAKLAGIEINPQLVVAEALHKKQNNNTITPAVPENPSLSMNTS